MQISISFIIGILVILLLSVTVPVNAQDYTRYCNARYGFCVDYPKEFGMEPSPDNGDGRQFYDNNGFILIASGINNINNTVQSEMRSQVENFDKVTYQKMGKNWFVLSGYKDTNIIYIKAYVGKGSTNHLYIRYPVNLKADYDKVIARVSRSFSPGRINTAH